MSEANTSSSDFESAPRLASDLQNCIPTVFLDRLFPFQYTLELLFLDCLLINRATYEIRISFPFFLEPCRQRLLKTFVCNMQTEKLKAHVRSTHFLLFL